MREYQDRERAPRAAGSGASRRSRARPRPAGDGPVAAGRARSPAGEPPALRVAPDAPSRIRRDTAPATPIAVSSDRPSTIRRIPVKFVDGVEADTPSTYDTAGGHSYKDHGAHTTKEQHMTRLRTGVAPSGRVSRVPPDKPSSKFASDTKHVEAFTAAEKDLTAKNKNKQKIRGAATAIPVSGAGISYWRDDTTTTSNTVMLDIVPVDDTTLRINSMYPTGDA